MKLLNCLPPLERIDKSGPGVKPDLSSSARYLVLKSHDLDRLILFISQAGGSEASLTTLQQAKNAAARARYLLFI